MGAAHFGALCAEMQAENLFAKRNKRRVQICSKKKDKQARQRERGREREKEREIIPLWSLLS